MQKLLYYLVPLVLFMPKLHAQLSVNTAIVPVSCFGNCNGQISIFATGGTLPYSYIWSNNGSWNVQSNLCAGAYSVTVIDAANDTVVANLSVPSPNQLQAQVQTLPDTGSCNGRTSIAVSGGTAPYSYLWNNGATSNNLNSLCSGTYCVSVSDLNGCQASTCGTVALRLPLHASITPVHNICAAACEGQASVSVSGGQPPYSYLWSLWGQTTASISGLCAGYYSVTVSDSGGDTLVLGTPITYPPMITQLDYIVTNTAADSCTGSMEVILAGGAPPYTYQWSNGDTGAIIQNLCARGYTVTITSSTGCFFIWRDTIEVLATAVEKVAETKLLDFSVFPNPSKDDIHLAFNFELQDAFLEIFDPLGQVIIQQNLSEAQRTLQISLAAVPPGFYLLKIRSKDQSDTRIIIRQ